MTASRRFCRTPGAGAGLVDGQTVVVSPTDLRYHALNTTAAAVWGLLADGTTVDQVDVFDRWVRRSRVTAWQLSPSPRSWSVPRPPSSSWPASRSPPPPGC